MALSLESSGNKQGSSTGKSWRKLELAFYYAYAAGFVLTVAYTAMQLSTEPGGMSLQFNFQNVQYHDGTDNLDGWQSLAVEAKQDGYMDLEMGGSCLDAWIFRIVSGGIFVAMRDCCLLSWRCSLCLLFLLAIGLGNFLLVKLAGGQSVLPIVLWVYNLSFLVCNRVYSGYEFTSFGERWAFLDKHRGIMRWHISFNMVMLRMVSFGLDYHWAEISRRSTVDWEKHTKSCSVCQSGGPCYLLRQELPLTDEGYSLVTYLSYLFFAPLYVAGPIVTYNAFTSQLNVPQKSLRKAQVTSYGLRWLACFMLMELLTHFCYFNSLAISRIWQMLSPAQTCIVGYGVLNFMWLKFLLIWRFFRFWSLVGGVEAPENMLRCVNNCYDLEGFWKSWHASYNRWLVRYMYIPLGGSKWRLLNVWLIFTFVALWHDLEWKLLSWAWVTCLLWGPELTLKFSVPSICLTQKVPKELWGDITDDAGFSKLTLYNEFCAAAGALNVVGLLSANLVGFVVGPSGMRSLVARLISSENIPLLFGIFFTFFVGCKIMFHVRDVEARSLEKIGND